MSSYTLVWNEISFWKEHIKILSDPELVDEIAYLCYDHKEVDNIVYEYYDNFESVLTEKDRDKLEWFFVLVNLEELAEE